MKNKTDSTRKISIIGCGSVGATTAYTYLLSGSTNHLVLIDRDAKKAEGLMLDLEHSTAFTPYLKIEATASYSACAHSQLIVITAGVRQLEGESRLDLVKKTKAVFAEIIPKIAKVAPQAILLVVSNPVDVLT